MDSKVTASTEEIQRTDSEVKASTEEKKRMDSKVSAGSSIMQLMVNAGRVEPPKGAKRVFSASVGEGEEIGSGKRVRVEEDEAGKEQLECD